MTYQIFLFYSFSHMFIRWRYPHIDAFIRLLPFLLRIHRRHFSAAPRACYPNVIRNNAHDHHHFIRITPQSYPNHPAQVIRLTPQMLYATMRRLTWPWAFSRFRGFLHATPRSPRNLIPMLCIPPLLTLMRPHRSLAPPPEDRGDGSA